MCEEGVESVGEGGVESVGEGEWRVWVRGSGDCG